jgi:hypothetical protein
MTDPGIYKEPVQLMRADIRLEVLLAEILAEDAALDDIVVMSNSLFTRNFHRDIEKTGEIQFGQSRKRKLYFLVNREGIYDRLPEDLFHQPIDADGRTDKEAVIGDMKTQEEIEKSSRLFFLPIEQEFYRQRLRIESEEKSFLSDASSSLNELWNLPAELDDAQKSKLCTFMPVLNKITGNLELTGFLLEHIYGSPVEITESAACTQKISAAPLLQECRLGIDTVLGGELSSLQSSITIKIFIPDLKNLADYMPGGEKLRQMELLCSLFIPWEKEIIYETALADAVPFITEEETSYFGILNYTTTI